LLTLAEKQVASVIRVIPSPGKDIALNILSQFHYARELPITTVETLVEALDKVIEQNGELELEATIGGTTVRRHRGVNGNRPS
jgi:hypothetical protein